MNQAGGQREGGRARQTFHRNPRRHLLPVVCGVVQRDVAANRAADDHGVFKLQRLHKRVHEFGVLVNLAVLFPLHRIRAGMARQIERIGMKPTLGQQRQQVLIFQRGRAGGVDADDRLAFAKFVVKSARALNFDVVAANVFWGQHRVFSSNSTQRCLAAACRV